MLEASNSRPIAVSSVYLIESGRAVGSQIQLTRNGQLWCGNGCVNDVREICAKDCSYTSRLGAASFFGDHQDCCSERISSTSAVLACSKCHQAMSTHICTPVLHK